MKEEMTMKKMITNMKALAALLMVGAAVTSCSSDDSIIDQPDAPQVYTMTVEASKGTNGTRALADEGTTLTSTWSVDDKIEVWTADGTTKKYGELTAQSAGANTTLSGTLDELPSNSETLTLKYLSPSYGSQDGTLTGSTNSIDKVCDYATATVKATVNGSSVTTTTASFENQQAVVKFTLKNKAGDSDLSATVLKVTADGNTYTVTPTSAASVLYVAVPAISAKEVSLTAIVGEDTYSYTNASVTFANGNFYRITVNMTKQSGASEGALSGQFSVSATKKVYFSKGNLQATYDGSSWTWKFADHQYDYVGNAAANTSINGNGTVSTNGTVDFFGWVGASSTWTGEAQYGISNSTSTNNTNGYGNSATESLKSDWGSNIGSGWRTLEQAEWAYLFNTRTVNGGTGSGKSYTLGQKVNNVLGVVLYPDDYTGSAYTTGSDWATFESAGCVFLPAAGYRDGSTVSLAGSYGYYWSSSPYASRVYSAYNVYFSSGNLGPANNDHRYCGCSVRLVRQVE